MSASQPTKAPFIDGDQLAVPAHTLIALLDEPADPGMMMKTTYMHLARVNVTDVIDAGATTILAVWGKPGDRKGASVSPAVAMQLRVRLGLPVVSPEA